MKLEKELKKNSGLNLWNSIIIIFLVAFVPLTSTAEPTASLDPGSFAFVDDKSILESIGISSETAWCYDISANAVLITAPARERAKCDLRILHELEKQKVKYKLQIDNLQIRVNTLKEQHRSLNAIKDKEIDRLSEAALKRPNDYSVWWATGGFITGVLTTIGVVLLL